MKHRFQRFEFLIGENKLRILEQKHVVVFGVGGVGSFAVEALARSGIGKLTIVDYDTVDMTNINRQIHANDHTIGQIKVEAMADRLMLINPKLKLDAVNRMITPDNADDFFDSRQVDYIIDAIDMVTSKIELVLQAQKRAIPIIASMGTGNKLDPTRLKVTDLYKTEVCPLARVMRRELKARGIKKLKVVFSDETPIIPDYSGTDEIKSSGRKLPPGSCSFVPSSAGLILASVVINDFLNEVELVDIM
ncbi:tRNA threonylcarbamoyladenosine dehydratase [Fusibacter ferrireducens]|uniref:tRNA threonylcarbamoyladenosine dehydratase n=1 Tax=Fusibacter ferrireducens TaxID=2785058 RepID=A0ABR9ZQQ7_9FIRM|nr:tRNA threonylcarbamoyladenosine dehydratase [Fusibacter ferrireducens]MBF4692798.1 tRNA threonylcarbamoyladenosine dehydratase [Fusibacter ferrireducens]